MQVPGATAAAAAARFTFASASASAPTGPSRNLATLAEDELELSERDLWEDDAGDLSLLVSVLFGLWDLCDFVPKSMSLRHICKSKRHLLCPSHDSVQ